MRRGLAGHPTLAEADARLDAAEAARRSVRGHYGPKVIVEGNVIVYDKELSLSFGGGGDAPAPPPPESMFDQYVAGVLGALGQPATVREQVTTSASVALVQPLTGLYAVNVGTELAEEERGVAATERVAAERRIAAALIEAYFRVLQAAAMHEAASAGVQSLESRLGTVESLERHGVAGRNDVLRMRVAVEAARQEAIATANGVLQARAALAATMGEETPDFGAPEATAPAWAEPPTLDEARKLALERRPELAVVGQRVGQAETGVTVARAAYIPELNLVGQYQHTTGSELAEEDTLFAGAFLKWTAFEWGVTSNKVEEAQAGVQRARAGLAQARTQVSLQVQAAWYAHASAKEALGVAAAAVEHAEEAARLERLRHDAQKATTADMLDAETELTRARMRLEAARYDRIIAHARLRDAMGEPLTGDAP